MKIVPKVGAFVIRPRAAGPAELLLFTHVDFPDAPIQIPGGTIEPGEEPEVAAARELHEEGGVGPLPLLRALGISEVASTVDPDVILRRHGFLFDGSGLPDEWTHTVTGGGDDYGLRFAYRWHPITPAFAATLNLNPFLLPAAIPELYPPASSARFFSALSVVAPAGEHIRAGRKTLEVRRWQPETLPLCDLLIVQNGICLCGKDGPLEDPDGEAMALVDVVAARPWEPHEVKAARATEWAPGWVAWELSNVRPVRAVASVPARRKIYQLSLDEFALIRSANPADAAAIARSHVEAWRTAYRGIIPAAYLEGLSVERRTVGWEKNLRENPGAVLVAERGGKVVGWVSFGASRDEGQEHAAEIYALYVDAAHQRGGLGRTLLSAAENELARRLPAATRIFLWVLERNAEARRFYERTGYVRGPLEKQEEIGGESFVELRYERKP